MRAALIGAADFNEAHFKSQTFDYLLAVDGGWATCVQAGIPADIVVGDFDSLGFIPEGVPVKEFPRVKDESDMELACMHAQEMGAGELFFYGAFSGRLDHSIANIQLMLSFAQQGLKTIGIGQDFALVMLSANAAASAETPNSISFDAFDPAILSGEYAPYLSTFAIAGDAHGLDISGLAYEVAGFTLLGHVSRGLSNEFAGAPARIRVQQGNVLVTLPLDALAYAHYGLS